jgi:ABC-type lipoprotein release transport system permease subunit
MYFLAFSSFLIFAALLLVSLLFRLNLDRRGAEVGLLAATGLPRRAIRRLALGEGIIVAAIGAVIGVGLALAYAWALLALLRAWWPGNLDPSILRLYVSGWSILAGYLAALVVSILTIAWSVRAIGRVSPVRLLAGETTEDHEKTAARGRWAVWTAALCLLGAAVLWTWGRFVHDHMTEALGFFGSGALVLAACLAGAWAWMHRPSSGSVTGHGFLGIARLGIRNAPRHAARGGLTIGLLAFAVFIVTAAAAFQKEATGADSSPKSGTGGFAFVGETALPIYQDLQSDKGRAELNFPDSAASTLARTHVHGFRLRAGDDTSCLNLFAPTRPQILGAPDAFIGLGRFRFSAPKGVENPWELLQRDDADEIPAIADGTTAQYILKKGVGDVIEITDGQGEPIRLRLIGLLADSILQSQLVISESNFLRVFPRHEGYQFFLVDVPANDAPGARQLLESTLADQGLSLVPAARRLEEYYAVENTYLATFRALGGLGVLLGACGLAVVLLRTAWERRRELSLLRALGFRRAALRWLLLAENGVLLLWGVAIGLISASLAVAPHLGRTSISIAPIMFLLSSVVGLGLFAGAAAACVAERAPIVASLREN